jgi:putative SOS response-associated peptidase YedK
MCGKFTQMASWAEVHTFSTPLDGDDVVEGDRRQGANDREETFTPMRDARVIRPTEAGKREFVGMRWGWPDRWTRLPVDRPKHMHAKGETVDVLRTFKDSFAMRRSILPVRSFNVGEEAGKKVIQHVLTRPRRQVSRHRGHLGYGPEPRRCADRGLCYGHDRA